MSIEITDQELLSLIQSRCHDLMMLKELHGMTLSTGDKLVYAGSLKVALDDYIARLNLEDERE